MWNARSGENAPRWVRLMMGLQGPSHRGAEPDSTASPQGHWQDPDSGSASCQGGFSLSPTLWPERFPCVVKAMTCHYFFTPEIRGHRSIQSLGEEPLSRYLWIILTIAFVWWMFFKIMSHDVCFCFFLSIFLLITWHWDSQEDELSTWPTDQDWTRRSGQDTAGLAWARHKAGQPEILPT